VQLFKHPVHMVALVGDGASPAIGYRIKIPHRARLCKSTAIVTQIKVPARSTG